MKDVSGPGDFLAWLGGADLKVLALAPGSERTRFIQMAIVLLTTSGIGALSMMFALRDGVHTAAVVAVIGGLVWGFIILNLDRFLVLSMGHTRDWKRLLLMALPRLLLAAVISTVVATPLTLRIFASDITNQMAQSNAAESKQVAAQQAQSGPATQAAALRTKINTDKSILAGNLQGTVSNPGVTFWQGKVNTLTPEVKLAQTAMDTAQAAYQCEVDGSGAGCEGASDLQGNGPMAQLKENEYNQAKQQYATLDNQLQSAQQQLATAQSAAEKSSGQTLAQQQAAAKSELPGLQTQYNQLEAELTKNETRAQAAVDNNTGILAQLQNLSDAGAKDPILGVAQWVVTLLFFCIEILPVTVKVLMNIGPLSTYEVLLKNEEDMIADQAKLTRVTTRRDAEREADKRIALDEHMRQLEEGLGKKANMHVANHMEQILDVALAEWSRNVQAGLSVKLPPQAQPGNTAGAPPRPVVSPRARIGITGPQPVLGGTGTQPPAGGTQPGAGYNVFNGNVFNGNAVNGNAVNGNGANGSDPNASAPTVTFLSPAAGGYAQLPDEDDGDLL